MFYAETVSAAPVYTQLMFLFCFFNNFSTFCQIKHICYDLFSFSFALLMVYSDMTQIQGKLWIFSCKAVKCWIMTSYQTTKTQVHHCQYQTHIWPFCVSWPGQTTALLEWNLLPVFRRFIESVLITGLYVLLSWSESLQSSCTTLGYWNVRDYGLMKMPRIASVCWWVWSEKGPAAVYSAALPRCIRGTRAHRLTVNSQSSSIIQLCYSSSFSATSLLKPKLMCTKQHENKRYESVNEEAHV